MALIGQEHVFKIYFLTYEYLTSQHNGLTRRHKELTIQHNYLTNDGRSIPPYRGLARRFFKCRHNDRNGSRTRSKIDESNTVTFLSFTNLL